MSIPLDRLYHHLENLCDDNIVIYRWWPHGSKNLNDLQLIRKFSQDHRLLWPMMIAHDQEPLDYDFLELQNLSLTTKKIRECDLLSTFHQSIPKLRRHTCLWNIYEKSLLCHSEKNSTELEKFNLHFIGVYYWSHAMIARDWFRFAEHDLSISNNPLMYTYDFLIYNRAWSGLREYRLKFAELLIENNLVTCSLTKFSPIDNGTHYTQHKFKNLKFQISNFSIDSIISNNTHHAIDSADYVSNDYNACGIEIILETLFDDTRHHLTEKTLRAIACRKPFILASTPGALQYLKDYGFKTFNGLIDESYDLIQDPAKRLEAIVREMLRIKNLNEQDKLELFNNLNIIAEYNKKLFFSTSWQKMIEDEFVLNFKNALGELEKFKNGKIWKTAREIIRNDTEIMNEVYTMIYPKDAIDHLNLAVDHPDTNFCQ